MARLTRLSVADCPHHVLLRGHNRQPVFQDDEDRARFLALLQAHAQAQRVAVHGYVLLDSRIHLVLTPAQAPGLALLMQALGRSYVRYHNDRHARSGTLWEGRYRSAPMEAGPYQLPCLAWLDGMPVREGLCVRAADWPWGSHRHYVGLVVDRVVTPPPGYWGLGNTPFAREAAYAEMVHAGLGAELMHAFERLAQSGWPLGGPAFLSELEKLGGRRAAPRPAGRPRKHFVRPD